MQQGKTRRKYEATLRLGNEKKIMHDLETKIENRFKQLEKIKCELKRYNRKK
jgi:hypothetical protein